MSDEKKTKEVQARNKIKRVVNRIAETQDGKEFFNHLMRLCGHGLSSINIDPQRLEINTFSTVYNEARKTVYYQIRELIDPKLLKEIEYLEIKEKTDYDT